MKNLTTDTKGGSQIFVIVIVILIAVLLAGGELFLGKLLPIPDFLGIDEDQVNSQTPAASAWNLTLQDEGCITGQNLKRITVLAKGVPPGYLSVEISNGAGGFATVSTMKFDSPQGEVYEVNLPNELGFNTTSWRVRLFEGGTLSGSDYTGGIEKVIESGTATGC